MWNAVERATATLRTAPRPENDGEAHRRMSMSLRAIFCPANETVERPTMLRKLLTRNYSCAERSRSSGDARLDLVIGNPINVPAKLQMDNRSASLAWRLPAADISPVPAASLRVDRQPPLDLSRPDFGIRNDSFEVRQPRAEEQHDKCRQNSSQHRQFINDDAIGPRRCNRHASGQNRICSLCQRGKQIATRAPMAPPRTAHL